MHWLAPDNWLVVGGTLELSTLVVACEYVPTAQAVQVEPLAADDELRNVPDAHATQVLCPVLDWNVPARQLEQDCMPSAD